MSLEIYSMQQSVFSPLCIANATRTFRQRCLSFHPESIISNSTLMELEHVPRGKTLYFPDNVASCNRPSQMVTTDLGRIALSIPTSNRSSITFELWLPEHRNGKRYFSTGNGGIEGCVTYEDLAYLSGLGFPAMGTNNGHNGTTGVEFYHNPDILEDDAYLALHTGTVSGKLLTTQFYEDSIAHSYYIGHSLGIMMGVKGSEMYPDDYNGIIAGCPAVDFNHLQGERAVFFKVTGTSE
ncbi:Hypothetical protein R9X50_00334300 [Acrodontium crateriforme]|uniref:Carboxylic ester hydrolase n=1 Tax=Acrodontium crateriforme TaxID=150365 RepID=A0AAQ3M2S2_9PEZI|nr:Hypothetical protein R9X50_00334300 [Acrodontium crateriforme]